MTDSTLTRDQASALLRKLATDDDFRALFEDKPALALYESGIDAEVIVRLKAACLQSIKLAPKDELLQGAAAMEGNMVTNAMAMTIPMLRIGKT